MTSITAGSKIIIMVNCETSSLQNSHFLSGCAQQEIKLKIKIVHLPENKSKLSTPAIFHNLFPNQ